MKCVTRARQPARDSRGLGSARRLLVERGKHTVWKITGLLSHSLSELSSDKRTLWSRWRVLARSGPGRAAAIRHHILAANTSARVAHRSMCHAADDDDDVRCVASARAGLRSMRFILHQSSTTGRSGGGGGGRTTREKENDKRQQQCEQLYCARISFSQEANNAIGAYQVAFTTSSGGMNNFVYQVNT